MPVVDRLDWASRQVLMGRKEYICIGSAQDELKFKAKIILEPPSSGAVSPAVAGGLRASVDVLRRLAVLLHACDRGHKEPSGHSVIHIWFSFTLGRSSSRDGTSDSGPYQSALHVPTSAPSTVPEPPPGLPSASVSTAAPPETVPSTSATAPAASETVVGAGAQVEAALGTPPLATQIELASPERAEFATGAESVARSIARLGAVSSPTPIIEAAIGTAAVAVANEGCSAGVEGPRTAKEQEALHLRQVCWLLAHEYRSMVFEIARTSMDNLER